MWIDPAVQKAVLPIYHPFSCNVNCFFWYSNDSLKFKWPLSTIKSKFCIKTILRSFFSYKKSSNCGVALGRIYLLQSSIWSLLNSCNIQQQLRPFYTRFRAANQFEIFHKMVPNGSKIVRCADFQLVFVGLGTWIDFVLLFDSV